MSKILVTGATGLLGSTLVPHLRSVGHEVIACGRDRGDLRVDLRDAMQVRRGVETAGADVVINLAGATNVDECEKNPQGAYEVNVLAVENLVQAIAPGRARLVHVSTDHVYDGPGPHVEHEVTVRNQYAMSKLAGEQAALRLGPRAAVLRTNFVGRSECERRQSFSDWIVQSGRESKPIELFTDVRFSPLRMRTLSAMLARVADNTGPNGVFNLGATTAMSKAHFARALAQSLGMPQDHMRDARLQDRQMPAPRPRGMAMDSHRFEEAFGVRLPRLEEEVTALAQEYK
ncbi:MAG TPA: SDR family oxidoreductase [Ramlibacter sp.]|nr:SDR family oxidoreductase [Ramlibacter sp.]